LPYSWLAALDVLEQIDPERLRVLAADARRLLGRQAADPLLRLEVELHPEALPARIGPLEGVRAESIHVPMARRVPRSPKSQVN